MSKKKDSCFKRYSPIIVGFLFSLFFGGLSIVLFLSISSSSNAQPIATEADFDPDIVFSGWLNQDPWAPCREWVDIANFDDIAKAEAVTCVEKRNAALKSRRDYYLAPDQGWHKSAACNSACTQTCFSDAAAIGITVNCNNGYTPHPKSDVERTMIACKAECYKVSKNEEDALPSPNQVIRECCEAIEVSDLAEDEPNCFDGVQNGDEDGVDCGGSCDTVCESDLSVSISPKEVEMVADGKTSMDFVVTVTQDGKPLAGQEVSYRLQDERSRIDDDKEGEVKPVSAKTDANGQIKFTYTSAEQPRDFVTSTLVFQAIHPKGNPQARITLTPGFSIWCGNWQCQTGETHANCPEDCARDLSKQDAYEYIVKKYNEIPLNPYARQGVWCASCPTNNRVLKAMAIEELSSDQEKLEYAKRLKEQYEPWVCGSQQTRVINMLDGLRLSKDATERSIIEKYYDYGPIEVLAPPVLNTLAGHLAVAVYEKGTPWSDAAKIFDLWLMNSHSVYGISEWEDKVDGQAHGFQCDPPFYPLCGGTYQRVQRPELKLSSSEKAYFDSLDQVTKDKITASINERAYKDVKDAQMKYMIERMMAFDARDKVRVVVQCPFNVMIVNKETGARVGYDADGNFIAEDADVYPEIRAFADNEVVSYFMMPKDGDYEVKASGIDSGKATVMTSYPTSDGEFEVYEYNNIDVKNDSGLTLNLDSEKTKAVLTIDGKQIDPKLLEKGVADSSLNYLVAVAEGLYPEENVPGLGGEVFSEEFPPLMFEPVFDGWSVFMLILALGLFALGIIYFNKLRKKDKKTLGTVVLVLCILLGLLFLLIVAGRYAGEQEEVGNDYRTTLNNNEQITNNKESRTSNAGNSEEVESEIGESSLSYKNDEYGYELTITPSWEGYMAETLPVDGENAIAVTQFYLPTAEDSEYSDKPGWFKMMTIQVYTHDSWEWERKDCEELDMCWDEEIGRDANNVYAWSYFNGMQPNDIAEQAIMDMQEIVKTFKPSSNAPITIWNENTEMEIYQNCGFGYKLAYPKTWVRKTTDESAENSVFSGDNITIAVHASDYGMNLDEFVADRTASWKQEPISSRDQSRDGKRLIAREYSDPDAVYVFWEEGEYDLELAVTGSNIEDFINGVNFFGYFDNNIVGSSICE
ncbi:MAG: Ig-like domain-containing protein [Patescibacteria group bacterium]|nr:Ig-like domain-containing protein [Patescibacteria group bacterium]